MSAIVGVYYLDGRPVESSALARMVASVAHRGPDGADMWCEASTGLGHRMLWTTPESMHEQLPCIDRMRGLVLTADARLDNRDELITALGLTDRTPCEIGDGPLILEAYARWGETCPEKLLGDYAFAVWDARRQRLFCARDTAGVKPFYYVHRPGRLFAFGSEIKTLFCLSEVPRQINEVRIAYHLISFYDDPAITFYCDVLRLPAAHSMTVSSGGIRLRRYWSLEPSPELRLRSDEEYAEAFRAVFTEAVRCRLRSAFPVSSTLSGGLDSSSIACTARDLLVAQGTQRLHTFSVIFPNLPQEDRPLIDERPCIRAVVAMGEVEPHEVIGDQISPLANLDQMLWHGDEAYYGPNLHLHWALGSAGHQHGARVMLDGTDGDTTVSHGWTRLTELIWTGRWKTFLAEATATARKWRRCRRELVRQYGLQPLVLQPAGLLWWRLRGRPIDLTESAIHPDFAHRVGLLERIRADIDRRRSPALSARQMHRESLTAPIWPYALELADKAVASCCLEFRFPFFDRRLMEFCFSLPSAQKFSRGWTRVIMRRAMQGTLPKKVQWRVRKATLAPNFQRKLLEYEQPTLEDAILYEPRYIQDFVDVPELQGSYHRYAADPMDGQQDINRVYRAVILSRWLRQLEGGRPPDSTNDIRCTHRHRVL